MKQLSCIAIASILVVCAGTAEAGGFNIYEMSARATALGGAFTATADDPSALFYNPAGTAWLPEGWAVSANMAGAMPHTEFAIASGITELAFPGDPVSKTRDAVFTPSGLYITYRHDDEWSYGFAVSTPFGLGVEWDDPFAFPGRPLSVNAQIQGLYFGPSVTFMPDPRIAFSFGANGVITHLQLERHQFQNFGGDNMRYDVAEIELRGTSELSAAPQASIMVKPNDKLSIGVNYRGGVTNTFKDQEVNFTVFDQPAERQSLEDAVRAQINGLGEQKVSGDLDFPAILMTGVRYQFTPAFSLEGDFIWFNWAAFDEVILEFTNAALTTDLREDYADGQQYRFGAEYVFNENVRGMAGFVFDNSPQPDGSVSPLLPDANRLDYSFGLSYGGSSWEVTAAYMFVDFKERSTVEDGVGLNFEGFDGAYDTVVHIPTVGFTKYF